MSATGLRWVRHRARPLVSAAVIREVGGFHSEYAVELVQRHRQLFDLWAAPDLEAHRNCLVVALDRRSPWTTASGPLTAKLVVRVPRLE
jgi:hypothetical protein